MSGFVCIYYGNTGSSWLLAVLGGSSEVLVPGFEPIEGWVWNAPINVRIEWLRTALSPPHERSGEIYDAWAERLTTSPQVETVPAKPTFRLVGLKMGDLAVGATKKVADVIVETDAKAILLTRDNRIKHALSLYRYHEEGKSQFYTKGVKPPSEVDLKGFDKWLKESNRLHTEALRVRRTLHERLRPDQVTSVSYEEFTTEAGKRETIDRLTEFIGIAPIKMTDNQYAKATPDDLRSAVVNYRALKRRYAMTPMRRFFQE